MYKINVLLLENKRTVAALLLQNKRTQTVHKRFTSRKKMYKINGHGTVLRAWYMESEKDFFFEVVTVFFGP